MFDPSKPMLPDLTLYKELDQLNDLYRDAEAFLNHWSAYNPNQSDKSADAVVALLGLQKDVADRRTYILNKINQKQLPF